VNPGDVVIADDDGVCVVARLEAAAVLKASEAREAKEATARERLQKGELGVDIYDMRDRLAKRGLVYRRKRSRSETACAPFQHLMRGGTSRDCISRKDLPQSAPARDRALLAAMGSPDPRQIDGVGGAHR